MPHDNLISLEPPTSVDPQSALQRRPSLVPVPLGGVLGALQVGCLVLGLGCPVSRWDAAARVWWGDSC